MNFKQAVLAILSGKLVQHRFKPKDYDYLQSYETWQDFNQVYEGLLHKDVHLFDGHLSQFRIAPRTILVNGVEVPAPEMVAPKVGATYYIPTPATGELWSERWNQCEDVTARHIERGLVYLNKEDAIVRAKAMLRAREGVK